MPRKRSETTVVLTEEQKEAKRLKVLAGKRLLTVAVARQDADGDYEITSGGEPATARAISQDWRMLRDFLLDPGFRGLELYIGSSRLTILPAGAKTEKPRPTATDFLAYAND